MSNFFQWIATLSPPLVWSMFILLCLLLAIYPFHKQLKTIFKNKLSNVSPEIIDFSWRLTSDHFLFYFHENAYYINSKKNDFLIEGGKVMINWKVNGAYRIDIENIGQDLKGNSAWITISKQKNKFKLIAYTIKGKLIKNLEIDPNLIRTLDTLNLSNDVHFTRKGFNLTTKKMNYSLWRKGVVQNNIQTIPLHFNKSKLNTIKVKQLFKNKQFVKFGNHKSKRFNLVRFEYRSKLKSEKKINFFNSNRYISFLNQNKVE
jgi:hypothetical protein